MRRTCVQVCLLVGLMLAAGGCSGQQWANADLFGLFGPSPMFRQVPVTPSLGPGVIIRPTRPAPSRTYAIAARPPAQSRPAAIPGDPRWRAAGRSRPWRYIVIHHSATVGGNAQQFDAAHRNRGWDELGYHFVIDNGNGGLDGRIEVGSRWASQKHGAHTGGTPDNEYNELGIGICLVGDFSTHMPTGAQLAALDRLVAYLVRTYDIPPERVITHRDAPNASTTCPGGLFHAYVHGQFKASLQLMLASTCPAWQERGI